MDEFIKALLEQISATVVTAFFLYAGVQIIKEASKMLSEKSTREIERFRLVLEQLSKRCCGCDDCRNHRESDP